jgi:hypothetical protein
VPHHIKGTLNVVADTLSRMFETGESQDSLPSIVAPVLCDMPLAFEDLTSHQAQDPEITAIIQKLEAVEPITPYSMRDGLLYCDAKFDRKPKVVLPHHLIPIVFSLYHESPVGGHLGVYKTIRKIRELFILKTMDKDTKVRVKGCHPCRLSKPTHATRVGFLASDVANAPMEKIFIDYVGPFPRSKMGNLFALVAVDAFPNSRGFFQ